MIDTSKIVSAVNYNGVPLELGGGGGGGKAYEVHDVEFTLASSTYIYDILPTYIEECAWFAIYPTDADNTQTNTIAVGWWCVGGTGNTFIPPLPILPTTATGVALSFPTQYMVNDLTYNATRTRGNIGNKPAGNYHLKFYGIAK